MPRHRRHRGDRASRYLRDAGRGPGRGCRPEAVRHRQPRCLRLVPALRRRYRRAKGHPRLVHHPVRGRHGRAHPDPARREDPPRRHGALHLRPPPRLPHLPGQRRLRAAGHGRGRRAARGPVRLRGREPPRGPEGREQPLLHLRREQVHLVQPLRSRVRRGAGHVRPHHLRPGFRFEGHLRCRRVLPRQRVRLMRRVRAGLPDRHPAGEERHRARHADSHGQDHMRLLRGRLLVQGRAARQ